MSIDYYSAFNLTVDVDDKDHALEVINVLKRELNATTEICETGDMMVPAGATVLNVLGYRFGLVFVSGFDVAFGNGNTDQLIIYHRVLSSFINTEDIAELLPRLQLMESMRCQLNNANISTNVECYSTMHGL